MTSKSGRSETLELHARPNQPRTENAAANHEPNHDEIRRRAYEIYLERGSLPGRELDDWLRAERELEKVALFERDWDRLQQRVDQTPKAEINIRPMETKERRSQ